jgi:hypothetical protein
MRTKHALFLQRIIKSKDLKTYGKQSLEKGNRERPYKQQELQRLKTNLFFHMASNR